MNIDIYYFTGTGNSYYIAKKLSEKLIGELIPIAQVIDRTEITTDADVIGIVFPVYYGDIPVIVKDFCIKLKNIQNKFIFAVANYGGGFAKTFLSLNKYLKSNGGQLKGKYGIHMPQNAFLKKWENNKKIILKSHKKIEIITNQVKQLKKGFFFSNIINFIIIYPIFAIFDSLGIIKKSMLKYSGLSMENSLDKTIKFSDKSYKTNELCNGCGICVKVCPVNNIIIENNKPKWYNNCETCLACYSLCPVKAIEGGVGEKGYFYKNPFVEIKEVMSQKKT